MVVAPGSWVVGAHAAPENQPGTHEEHAYYATSWRVYGSWFASIYDAITAPVRHLRRRVAWLARIGHGMHVLDAATGTGAQARAFAEAGASVVGIDLSPRMLAIARRKSRGASIEYLEGDATAVPLPDAGFDAACVSFALHEMPGMIRERVMAELARVTRRGGTIVVVDYARPRNRVWRFIIEHVMVLFERASYREFLRSDLHELLARSGISVVAEHTAALGTARILVAART
jgi:ubiquinone/menaquinone biosynthesis C-methylase UbiE